MKHFITLSFHFLLSLAPALAAEKVALVIGNNAYQHGTPLNNCINDARAVTAALKAAGFQVIVAEDASLEQMEAKTLEFRKAAQNAKAAWFHYSGHGAEVKGTNYLIPVDADVKEEFQVKHKAFALDQMLGAMEESKTPLKVVVLDCCRDNPYGRGWSRTGAKGLGQVGETPAGTIIAFATSPGKVAADGAGQNSPFTSALVSAIKTPGLDVKDIFNETGRQVLLATNKSQQPWINSSFFDRYVLLPGATDHQTELAGSPLDRGAVGSKYEAALPGGGKMVFRYCPPGNFMMSSPETEEGRIDNEKQVPVRITKGFWLAEMECTQASWQAVMGENPSDFKGSEQLPVENVSWEDVQGLIGKMNRAGGLPAGWKWALPTEAQWEYACRAGTTTAFSFGDTLTSRQANFSDSKIRKTVSVGSYTANAWGLHDMHGNVWEWCADWYGKELTGGADPLGASTGAFRVIRGGSWSNLAAYCCAAFRSDLEPGYRSSILGFRPALVPSR
jgi:formylglycine-generating enzyme required for sulfatase activity